MVVSIGRLRGLLSPLVGIGQASITVRLQIGPLMLSQLTSAYGP